MKRFCRWLAALLILLAAVPAAGEEITFTDSTGYSVTVPQKPRRVAVLFASYADMWQLAGGTVAITVSGSVDRGFVRAEDVVIVGDSSGKNINTELLIAAQPDLVLFTTDLSAQTQAAEVVRAAGIPAAQFTVDSVADYVAVMKQLTDLTGDAAAYQKNALDVQAEVEAVLKRVREAAPAAPSILLLRAYSTGAKAKTTDHFVGGMLAELGCDNIAEHARILLDELSVEAIVAEDPDAIFVTVMGEDRDAAIAYMEEQMRTHPAWAALSAVQAGRYYVLPQELFHYKPNARWGEAYAYLAKILYPDIWGA